MIDGRMIKKERKFRPPKTMFLPNREMIRIMIHANIKWSKTDKIDRFLLRFGILENFSWYLANT